jgi:hypothetical protein
MGQLGGWLGATWTLYRETFTRGARLALANWPVGLMVMVYAVLVGVAGMVALAFGLAGGLALQIVIAACMSSGLSLVEQAVRVGRVRMGDVASGFGAYLGDLITVLFLLWLVRWVADIVLAPAPFLHLALHLALLVFFNAVPELIYLGRHSGTELFAESYRFIGENWIEWFPANLALGACLVGVLALPTGPFFIVTQALAGVVLYFAMIVRGLLFLELSSSSRRGREFRRRAAG